MQVQSDIHRQTEEERTRGLALYQLDFSSMKQHPDGRQDASCAPRGLLLSPLVTQKEYEQQKNELIQLKHEVRLKREARFERPEPPVGGIAPP